MFKQLVAASAGLVGCAHAFWRMPCPGAIAHARIDPIVNPDEMSPHVHSIFGSSGFGMNSDFEEITLGACTSCQVKQDMSVYWHPALYFKDAETGEYELVESSGGLLVYYKLPHDDIQAFPKGFRMIAGANERREYTANKQGKSQADLEQNALGFNCLNYNGQPEDTLGRQQMPDMDWVRTNCPNGLRLEIAFPSCWDGHSLDSDDHKSHMAYPDGVEMGSCPEGYAARVPTILFENVYNTASLGERRGQLVLSNDDETGNGFHADFLTGWEEQFLKNAIATCTNLSGRIEDCPLFDIQDQETSKNCKIQNLPAGLKSENVVEGLVSLPGNGGLSLGGDDHSDDDDSYASPAAPGAQFKEVSAYAASAPAQSQPPVVNAAAAPPTTYAPLPSTTEEAVDPRYPRTEYSTSDGVVYKILIAEATATVTELVEQYQATTVVNPGAPSGGDAAAPAPEGRHRRHLHQHAHRH